MSKEEDKRTVRVKYLGSENSVIVVQSQAKDFLIENGFVCLRNTGGFQGKDLFIPSQRVMIVWIE